MFDYITADTHFGHTNINLYEPSRVSKAQMEGYKNFDEYMIDTWNETVKEDDTVLHLGDFAFKDGYEVAKKLKGNITLIIGNHDKPKHIEYYNQLGWKIIEGIVLDIDNSKELLKSTQYKFSPEQMNNRLLSCIVTDINGQRVMFSHFPVFDDNPYDKKFSEITNILEEVYVTAECDMNIHGHTHSAGAKEQFCKSACLELNEFKLIELM